jgi:regulation of enolase protein 1 (concanavalin A-like superfamily)
MKFVPTLLTLIISSLLGQVPLGAAEPPAVLFEERFRGPLDAGWSWLREDADGWKLADGGLQIWAQPGRLFREDNDAANVLLRTAPKTDGPFAVEVFVESRPSKLFEEATLYAYFDDDHWIGLSQINLWRDVRVRMMQEQAGQATSLFGHPYQAAGVWFRIVVAEGRATGYYRADESAAWQKMAEASLPAKGELKLALTASGGHQRTKRWATFRDFRILNAVE